MGSRYITAVVWRGQVLEWTTLAEVKGGWRVSAHREIAVEASPAGVGIAVTPLSAAIRAHQAAWKGRVILAVPADEALLRVLSLPSADPAELYSMAELQLDKFCPFPAEHMRTAVEVLEQHDKVSRVIVAAAQRETLEALGALVMEAGCLPDGVDVDLLGWWHHLGGRGAMPGCEILLLLRAARVDLIAAQDGQPALFRSFGRTAGEANGLSSEDLLEEINYTLIALEAEWGAVKPRFAIWRTADAPPAWEQALQQLPGGLAEAHDLKDLLPLSEGLARRAAQPAGRQINLAPPEWDAARRQRRTQRRVGLAAAVLAGIWLLGLGVLVVGNQVQRRRVAALKADVARLEKPADRVREQLEQAQTLEQYTDHSRSALEMLREISQRLPAGVRLTSFIYRKNNSLALRGEAEAPEMIYDFMRDLEQTKLFLQIKPEGITKAPTTPAGGQRTQFGLTLTLAGGPA